MHDMFMPHPCTLWGSEQPASMTDMRPKADVSNYCEMRGIAFFLGRAWPMPRQLRRGGGTAV